MCESYTPCLLSDHPTDRSLCGAALFIPVLVAGCGNLSGRVEAFVQADQYEEALALLEQWGAGRKPRAESEYGMRACTIYENAIPTRLYVGAASELTSGNAREALQLTSRGAELCPWRADISALHERCSDCVALLDKVFADLRSHEPTHPMDVDDARLVSEKLKPVIEYINDTPRLVECQQAANTSISENLVARIEHGHRTFTVAQIEVARKDVMYLTGDAGATDAFGAALYGLTHLPEDREGAVQALGTEQCDEIRSLVDALARLKRIEDRESDFYEAAYWPCPGRPYHCLVLRETVHRSLERFFISEECETS